MKRPGGERPIYSVIGVGSPMLKVCAALSVIEREWARIVGDALASRSCPISYDDGVLVVFVQGQSALQDINFKKNAIIKEIRTKALLKLNGLKVEIGHNGTSGAAAATPRPARLRASPRVDPEAEEALRDNILSAHADLPPELAGAIARCRIISERAARGKKR
ncbi:MAG: DUF721 domain-containing protein [Synergistaceae bacterium]|jgi:hypothetical protein|nr:DUF721 domain-containing protein [Synergistaceae bacterium]